MLRTTINLLAVLLFVATAGQAGAVAPISPYADAILADNPIGYWRLGESSGPNAFDLSGNDLHGTYTGNVTLDQPGALLTDSDTSLLLDGSNGYINAGADDRLKKLRNDFTIEAWVRKNNGIIGGMVASNKGNFVSGYGLAIDANPSQLHFVTYGYKDYLAPFTFPDNEWTHIAVAFDSSNDAHFYVNGELETTVGGSHAAAPTSRPLTIGRAPYYSSSGSYGYFTGGLDEVAIYGRSLAPEEIQEHYLAAFPEPSLLVSIDIKPGNDGNPLNPDSNGNIPVAILGTDTFDVTTVDPATILLADAGVKERGKNGDLMSFFRDVNKDGLTDLLVHIDAEGLILDNDDIEAFLTGETFDGTPISGSDVIRIVGPPSEEDTIPVPGDGGATLVVMSVPEPTTTALLCMGVIGLLVFGRQGGQNK